MSRHCFLRRTALRQDIRTRHPLKRGPATKKSDKAVRQVLRQDADKAAMVMLAPADHGQPWSFCPLPTMAAMAGHGLLGALPTMVGHGALDPANHCWPWSFGSCRPWPPWLTMVSNPCRPWPSRPAIILMVSCRRWPAIFFLAPCRARPPWPAMVFLAPCRP